jgi:capsular exopolysaccharide synthesis family protein
MAHNRDHLGTAMGEPTPTHSGLDILSLAWRRKSLLVLGAVIGLALGSIYYARLQPIYQSSSQVLVVKKRPDALPVQIADPRFGYYDDYLSTHQVLLRSPLIIREAVLDGNLRGLRSFGGSDPTGAIIGGLTVAHDTKEGGAKDIMILSYQGTNPKDCATVLDAVIKSYRKFLDKTYQSVSSETEKLVKEARNLLDKELKSANAAYAKFRLDHPFLVRTKEGGNLRTERLVEMETKKLKMVDRRTEINDRLEAYEEAKKDGRSYAELLVLVREPLRKRFETREMLLAEASAKETQRITLEDQYLVLKMREQKLLLDYGDNHPDVLAVRANIELMQARMRRTMSVPEPGTGNPKEEVALAIKTLQEELDTLKRDVAFLDGLAKNELKEAKALIGFELQEATLRGEQVRTQQLFESVGNRLKEINLVKDLGGFEAQVVSEPREGRRVGPLSYPVFSVAMFLGLMAGLGMGYLVEMTDRSFRTPDDIRRRLGLPVVGCIPQLRVGQDSEVTPEEKVSALDPSLYVYHRAKSSEAEAYRGVRTSVLFSARREGCKVIQVTSPEMADGKSTLASNLAIAIAQSGKKVVLVDADFRRPRVHKLFGVPALKGLTSVLRGDGDLAGVTQPTEVPGLSILPCGPIPPNPAELLASASFHDLLKSLGDDFDFVLVDTPPLLAVTDPSVVVPCVDGVLLTIRLSKNARPNAERAKDILEAMGAKVLGVVVNGVDGRRGPGGYSYGYSYTYGAAGHYYSEDESETAGPEGSARTSKEDRSSASQPEATRKPSDPKKSRPSIFRWFFS